MKRREQVELSDHAQALASLRGLHVSRVLPVGGTRKVGQGVRSQAAAMPPRPLAVDRSEVET